MTFLVESRISSGLILPFKIECLWDKHTDCCGHKIFVWDSPSDIFLPCNLGDLSFDAGGPCRSSKKNSQIFTCLYVKESGFLCE
jgi:hypothetical protein